MKDVTDADSWMAIGISWVGLNIGYPKNPMVSGGFCHDNFGMFGQFGVWTAHFDSIHLGLDGLRWHLGSSAAVPTADEGRRCAA